MPKHTARPPEPTREQLQMAWRHLARPGWPATLDEALAQRSYSVALHGLARDLARAPVCVPAQPRNPGAYVPPTPTAPPAPASARARATPPRFDPKRAAANDFDE